MNRVRQASFFLTFLLIFSFANGQYVQPERNDTTIIMSQLPFDTAAARAALGRGNATIKGVAFTTPRSGDGSKSWSWKRIYANKALVTLFPVTPYLLDFLELKKKKQNPKKLRYVYLSNEAYQFRLTAITNSNGEFTFPNMKPGRYYLETTVGQVVSGTVDVYAGHANTGYGNVNYYQQKNYSNNYYDLATKFVDIQKDGEVVEIKLK